MSDREPTYFERLLAQSQDSRAERFVWAPGQLRRVPRPDVSRAWLASSPWVLSWSYGVADCLSICRDLPRVREDE